MTNNQPKPNPLLGKPFDRTKPTRVVFVGGGQDSVAILTMLAYDPDFWSFYVGEANLLTAMSDTGNEWYATRSYIPFLKDWCNRVGLHFQWITPEMGYHGPTWTSLTDQFERNKTIMGVAFPKSCSDQLKIKPSYRWLADELRRQYGFKGLDRQVFEQYRLSFGRMVTYIGFASGEESRRANLACSIQPQHELTQSNIWPLEPSIPSYMPKWRVRCIKTEYPLIDLGMNRQACQERIRQYGLPVPQPSNCLFCPYQQEAEIVLLYKLYPSDWQRWIYYETAKRTKHAGSASNLGVKGKLALEEYLAKALEKYGHWTIEELEKYRFSHGHAVASKF